MDEGIGFAITAHDRATAVLAKVSHASTAMAKNVSSGFRQMADDIKRESQQAQQATASLGKTMGSFIAGGAIVGGVLALGKAFISANANMETFNLQFETLLESSAEAKKRMEELAVFAASTPFELEGIAKASKLLQTYGGTALAVGDNLRMVGDAAAVAGVGIEDLAFWVGRAYAGLSNNETIGEALNRFTEMAVVGAKAKREINALIEQGDGMGAWKVLQDELNKSAGAMEKLSNSWVGVVSTIKDQFAEINRAIGDAGIWEELKAGIMKLRDELQKWIDSGGLKEFAGNVSGVIQALWGMKEPILWIAGSTGLALLTKTIVTFFSSLKVTPLGVVATALSGFAIAIDQVTDSMNRNSENRMTWFDDPKKIEKTIDLMKQLDKYEKELESKNTKRAPTTTQSGSIPFKMVSERPVEDIATDLALIEKQIVSMTGTSSNEIEKLWGSYDGLIKRLKTVKTETEAGGGIDGGTTKTNIEDLWTWAEARGKAQDDQEKFQQEQLNGMAKFTADAVKESDRQAKARVEAYNTFYGQMGTLREQEEIKINAHYDTLLELASRYGFSLQDVQTARQKAIDNAKTARENEVLMELKSEYDRKVAETELYYNRLAEMAQENSDLIKKIEGEKKIALDQLLDDMIAKRVLAYAKQVGHFAQLGDQMVDTIEMVAKASGASEAEMKKIRIASVVMNNAMAHAGAAASIWSTMDGSSWQVKLGESIAVSAMLFTQMGAQIAMINKGYEFGGIVQGQSASGDKTAINVNDKEMVVTTAQQAGLWNVLQGLTNSVSSRTQQAVTNIINIAGNVTNDTVDYLIEQLRVNDTYNRRYQIGGGIA